MKITKLILNNFSSYEGLNIFDLSNEENKPIILIGGQNGSGKTSLFTAIKIALYGPLAFGYTGINSFYTKKIKDYINTKVFQAEIFSSGVTIEIVVKQEREIKNYSISRNWKIIDKNLEEECLVKLNGELLKESDRVFFESYLMTVIPPDLFDFFLFDGEEVGNVFATEGYNKYIKNALLTMCGIDVFSIVQKFCKSYVDKSVIESDVKIEEQYRFCIEEISTIESNIVINEQRLQEITIRIDELNSIIEQREQEFLRAGGIPEEKRNELQTKVNYLEKKRSVISVLVKKFIEEEMPLFLLKGFTQRLDFQIDVEEKQVIYDYVKYKVTEDYLNSILEKENVNSNTLAKTMFQAILNKINPNIQNTESEIILDLSRDEISKIDGITSGINDYDYKKLINAIITREKCTKAIININATLRSSLSEEDSDKYRKEIENSKNEIEKLQLELEHITTMLELDNEKIIKLTHEKETLYKQILNNAQSKHVYKLSNDISDIMDKVIALKTDKIREQLASKTVFNLNEIYRKNNLISFIEIEQDFKFKLYQKQRYSISELQSLLNNVGYKEFANIIGEKSVATLCEYFDINDEALIEASIRFSSNTSNEFDLYKKIELSRLSKGERQIFILALYWAIIQISDRNIPFINDTPYARIDANHREEISRKFFPNISEQVIILSTDEEITEDYYPIIKPFISKEYLLINNQSENRTSVEERYFFEV